MAEFSTTLLREKFVIRDPSPVSDDAPVVALSNRMAVLTQPLESGIAEEFVVRAQNMHSCIRMAGNLVHSSQTYGPILNRPRAYDWEESWRLVTDGFERRHNPNRWVAIYHKGEMIYESGERHPFLDIIEACQHRNGHDYESAIKLAESAFRRAGKIVTIQYDSNTALVVNIKPDMARCGVILRGADRTRTFNFTAKPLRGRKIRVSECLNVCAAFLEGIQLAYQTGTGRGKIRFGIIARGSEEASRVTGGEERIKRLVATVASFEQHAEVYFRPEKPNLLKMASDAESAARKTIEPEILARIEAGEIDPKEWII